MFKNVLVICAGNICRSPTAEHLLQRNLAGTGIRVSSAGLTAVVGHPFERNALETLQRHDQQPSEHQARQLTPQILKASDLVLVMERRQLQDVIRLSPASRGKTFLLGKWQSEREIPDPYRQCPAAFEHAYSLIEEGADAWSRRLQPQR
ncbi:low molecular weight protein-tyrosine-phosphatase [Pseudomonas sp. BGr12]|uniref:low molecular weight protein-tyrosine-phosphatase n=1 Tax=unclassified Pseudomonas TaxID=196821 RepID=UPI0017872244|nr:MULTISPECIES: low molecular weight protein-tyrosine-phosphatase [unclassified Pseudomonas]MBD9503580.1 low molecular weight phosphotyrosine protein phosphatase [Pseudomonas sp. PDM17]MBD9574062.1 low molecular weight phosphotyrosine protein phosphatase [Pseudomonas sp. PDM23]MBD9671900.1 low molecular weight phosphotyrosine protein phosphatase [Pseudomonas sp. PDM21]MDL2425524.1 low molecular weight phosphotyrosine protein phosphatase [Pseudomonas sp. BJa5]